MNTNTKQAAQQYAQTHQYSLEYHDEGGNQGIDTDKFTHHLLSFHQSQTQVCSAKLIDVLENLTYWDNIPEAWKREINAFLAQQQTK